MRKSFLVLTVSLAFLLLLNISTTAGVYGDDWDIYLTGHQSDIMVGAIITMVEQVDLDALQAELYARHANRQEWHEAVVRALQELATECQAGILAQLAELSDQGLVGKYRGLWVGNVILLEATREALDIIVSREDVLKISPDYPIENIQPVSRGDDQPVIAGVENGLIAIRADEVWAMGYTGEGRLVSHLDTGVDGNHPALNLRWRGYDPRYADNPEWAWFDPVTFTDFPFDSGQHGTHTMGTICGLGEVTGDTIGVAFGAEWISAGVIDRVSIPRTVQDALASFEWMTDPDGDPSTVWDVPDVCSNSWGLMTGHGYPPCDETFWVVLDGCEAAGIIVLFAAGNEGPGANSLRRPADRATTEITSFSVGALDGNNPSFPIASFSSRGPSYCTPNGSPTYKPEVSAPGVNVRSSIPGGGYQGGWSGTSMACPHVAGVVALIRHANPSLTSEQVREILLETATDLGSEGEDNNYGMGIVDAYEAVILALAYLEGWGTLAGQITDLATGLPIQGATISIVDRPWQATSRADGWYYLFMPADTLFDIRVDNPPTHLPIFDQQMVTENETTYVDYALEGKVTVTLTASFANPEWVSYRSFYINGSWDNDGFYDDSWSGDLIEIRDDGEEPDQIAEDGVFTGEVMLARDTENTYSWAIYSEDYGGEDARLDDGADFDIPDLDPPDVPTLVVNPSGSDNNWVISVEGDNGLSLDLVPGVDSRPEKWGRSDSLYEGITYTFRFHVMHSDVASYGSGGIGGPDLQFTPEVDGPYDFIFDDRDDSYVVQMTGTEGPPTYLTAQSGLDHHIPVSWLPPGTVESVEMAYDDGQLENAYYYYDAENLMATMFLPESYPVVIDSVMIHVLTEGDPYWPWPDPVHDPVGISIFLDDGTGYPDPSSVFYTEVTAELGEWIRVNVDEIEVSSGAFWVAMNNLSDYGPYDGLGIDVYTDYPAHKWAREFGTWMLQDIYTGDHMIRAKVFGGGIQAWLGYDGAYPAGQVSPTVEHANNYQLVAGTRNDILSDGKIDNTTTYYPKLFSQEGLITDTQVLAGYNLYRDTESCPFDRGLIINSELITETSYDDWGDDPYGPIENGVLYYYQASAYYDIGGGNYVEVGPSNEATGMAENHPPNPPYNLEAEAVGSDVNLIWEFDDDIGDFDYFNIYRKLMPFGEWEVIATSETESYTDVIEEGEDGTYAYIVTAVDDGDPPLESSPSNTAYALVGHLPPSGLTAISDEEFQVPLRWMLPGSWCGLIPGDNPDQTYVFDPIEYELFNNTEVSDISMKSESGPFNPPVILDQGGPDEFGYTWIDSDEPGGPVYEWIDITDVGEQIPMTGDDQNLGPFDIGFDFSFYGETFSTFNICSNGFISFTSTSTDYFNEPIPSFDAPENLVAPFWDDMDPRQGGEYWYYSDGFETVISFINVPHYSSGGPYTYQIILRSTGTIIFQYEQLNSPLNSVTIGIQNGDQTIGLQVVYNADYIHSDMAIRIGTGPEGVAPAHYNLYRSETSPVPIDPAYMLTDTIPGEITSYIDTDGVENGTTYYYVLTAVWPDSVESPGSNEAEGTPANHSPGAPTDLEVEVDYYDVSLSWNFTDVMDDFDHFNIYRRILPEGDWLMVGTSTDPSYIDEIEPGNDGVYMYRVTAVDDGTPPLESDPSNTVFAPVGNLPPVNLRATSNQESVVPLRWSEPGLLPCTTLYWDDGQLANGYYYYDAENIMANHFAAPAPVEICTVWVHVLTEGDPYWPWPDPVHDPVEITIWEGNGSGYPGDLLYSEIVTCELGEWIMIALEEPVVSNDSDFWVGMNNLSDVGPYDGMGIDVFTDYPEHKWAREFDTWGMQDTYTGDHMIRVSVVSGGSMLLLTEDSPTAELAKANIPMDSDRFQAKKGIRNMAPSPYMSFAPGVSTPPMPLDTEELLGYNIYRDTEPDVPPDEEHLVNDEYIIETHYDDTTVVNGITHYYIATAVYDNNGNIEMSPPSNEVSATPREGGHLEANPMEIDTSGYVGEVTIANLNLSNDGGLPVQFNIETICETVLDIDMPYSGLSAQAKFTRNVEEYDKSEAPPEEHNPPVILGHGGPDEFGYIWIDSDEPGGPEFDWIDISGIGEMLFMSDDDNQGPFPMEFDFPFYGQFFSTFRVCSNGFLSFTSTSTDWSNDPIPSPSAPENLIAPFWEDIAPNNGGMIYWHSDQQRTIVSWVDVPAYDWGYGTGPFTFQVILYSSGMIKYQFLEMYPPLEYATIGIQDASQTIGLQIAYNQPYVHNNLAIVIRTGWLSADPALGTINAGENMDIDILLDAAYLEPDIYTGTIIIHGWDENQSLPDINIPVIFDVEEQVGIEDALVLLPKEFALEQNYPNPFNAVTRINYALPINSNVKLEVFNILGQKVVTLIDCKQEAGYKSVIWDGRSASGNVVSSGMYFYKLEAGEKVFIKRMMLLK